MESLILIKTNNNRIFYKADSFWTKTTRIDEAKIYNDDSQLEIDRWIISYSYNIKLLLKQSSEKLSVISEEYHECKMGYWNIAKEFLKNQFIAKKDTKEEDLGLIIYTHEILINGIENIEIVDIRKKYLREDKLNEILK